MADLIEYDAEKWLNLDLIERCEFQKVGGTDPDDGGPVWAATVFFESGNAIAVSGKPARRLRRTVTEFAMGSEGAR